MPLGRLERVELRNVWMSESSGFTPWLAREENIAILGDAIGIELEVEATEKDVGPFRADILCKDTADGSWVLVENQLERTDHTHLGQLVTYAAGLQAVTIVWIAQRFTEEHRAALDWLNEITDGRFRFFGLEIELWRIGDSPVAPKFNVICQPNDWTQTVTRAAGNIESGELSETRRGQLEYWTAFQQTLTDRHSTVRGTKPLAQNWNNFAIGRSNFGLQTFANFRDKRIGVILVCGGEKAKENFSRIVQQREQVELAIGQSLEWREMPEKKESHVTLRRSDCDPSQQSDWQSQHRWLADTLEAFDRVFRPIIKSFSL